MSQQPLIDLMPGSIRRQCELGVRTGRIVGAIAVGVLIVVVLTTQARWQLDRERQRHAAAVEQAATVHEAQQRSSMLSKELTEIRSYMDVYERVALPLNLSAVIATIVNELPPGVTIETLDMEAGERRVPRAARAVAGESNRSPRLLVVEISGIAPGNEDISLLTMRLRNHASFEEVRLDSNQTRVVRDVIAREFRLSFRVDLDRPYDVVDGSLASATLDHEMEAKR